MANKKILYSIIVIILGIVGAIFIFNKLNTSAPSASPSPSPTQTPTPTPTPSPSPSPSPSLKSTPIPTKKPTPSSTPTPTPSPTSSPTPTPIAFQVTALTANVTPTNYSGACPKQFDFTGNITSNSAGTLTYKWVRSDGASGSTQSMTFGAAGTQAANADSWTLGGTGFTYSGWEKIQILTPNSIESTPANFNMACS